MIDLAGWCAERALPVPHLPDALAERLSVVGDDLLATEPDPPLMAATVTERAAAPSVRPLAVYGRAGRGMASRTIVLALVDGSVGVWFDRLAGNVHDDGGEVDLTALGDPLERLWRLGQEALRGGQRVLVTDSDVEGRSWAHLDGPAEGERLWGSPAWTTSDQPIGDAADWLGAMPRPV